jgi:hypothetical protein
VASGALRGRRVKMAVPRGNMVIWRRSTALTQGELQPDLTLRPARRSTKLEGVNRASRLVRVANKVAERDLEGTN